MSAITFDFSYRWVGLNNSEKYWKERGAVIADMNIDANFGEFGKF